MSAQPAAQERLRGSTIALPAGALLRLQGPRGLKVTVEAGQVWITEEAQPDDVWLATGQRAALVGEGLAVLEAKGDARLRFD